MLTAAAPDHEALIAQAHARFLARLSLVEAHARYAFRLIACP